MPRIRGGGSKPLASARARSGRRRLQVVESNYLVATRVATNGVSCEQARHDRRLNATGVKAVLGPVTRQDQVGKAGLVGAEPIRAATDHREHVSLRRVDVGAE